MSALGVRAYIVVRDLGLAGLSGVLLILCFPKFDLHALAWVALVPLLIALEGKRLKEAYFLSWAAGIVFFQGLFYWMWTVPGWNLLDSVLTQIVYLPQYVALWGLALVWIRKRTGLPVALVAPALWVTAEYIRTSSAFLSLPWMFLGHSQYPYSPLIQISALTGAYGLSFLIVLVNVAIAEIIGYARLTRPFPAVAATGASLLLIGTLGYGAAVLSGGSEGQRLRVALVQGNIPQNQKWNRLLRQRILDKHAAFTRDVVQEAPALIIWPETAVPGDAQHDSELAKKVGQVAMDTKSHLLVGSAEFAKFTDRRFQGKLYNSMYLFSPDGKIAGQYRKIRLVPFGEYTPLRNLVSWPRAIAASTGDFLPGDQYTRFTIGGVPFGAVICWEIIFPDLVRQFIKHGAAFMVIATNEAWFGDTAAPYQLLVMTAFRAAENRVAIARSANTGVSAFIDPYGRITRRLRGADGKDLFVEGVLMGDIPVGRRQTFYTRFGDIFAYSMIGITILGLGAAGLRGQ